MLKLTILRRYSENGRRICDKLGEMIFDYEKGKLITNQNTCGKTTGSFDKKYSVEKKIIYEAFTSQKSLEEAFQEIRKAELRIEKVYFANSDNNAQAVILIDE